jgi:hypothetical protein
MTAGRASGGCATTLDLADGEPQLRTMLFDDGRPQTPSFIVEICARCIERRLKPSQAWKSDRHRCTAPCNRPARIDAGDRGTATTGSRSRQLRGSSRPQVGVGWPNFRRVDHPARRNDLLAFPRAIMSQQAAKPRVVAQHRIEAEVGKFVSFGVQEPLRVRFQRRWVPKLCRADSQTPTY